MNISHQFDLRRFMQLLAIETSNVWKKVLLATGMFYAISFFIYVDATTGPDGFFEALFIFFAFLSGALFTSIIFSDMHHPLERFQFLTLPCSPLERLASKFVITGPLFVVYVLLTVSLFKAIAPVIVEAFGAGSAAQFVAFDEFPAIYIYFVFFTGHALFLIGAIYFRSFAVVKTALCLFVLPYTFFFVGILSVKLIYFDHFESAWSLQSAEEILPGVQILLLRSGAFILSVWAMFYLWLLFLGYSCLKDHEA